MGATCDSHTSDPYLNNVKDFKSIRLELRAAAAFKVPAKKSVEKNISL
jgi:hypothetical protein